MAIVPRKPNVNPSENVVKSRSKVPFSYHNTGTYRFGHYSPHFVMEGVNGDKINLRSVSNVRTYSLKAPLMAQVNMKKDYFLVPNEALLPLNWEKVYIAPVNGDDVVSDNVNCILPLSFFTSVAPAIAARQNAMYTSSSVTREEFMTYMFKSMVFLESVYSTGSLFETLGIHLHSLVPKWLTKNGKLTGYKYFDQLFDAFVSDFLDNNSYVQVEFQNEAFTVGESTEEYDMTWRQFIEKIHDDYDWRFLIVDEGSADKFIISVGDDGTIFNAPEKAINLSRLLAYQISCAHFFTNDKIDYIYNADLYRQNVYSCFSEMLKFFNPQDPDLNAVFSWNGLSLRYDVLAGFNFAKVASFAAFIDFEKSQNLFFNYWRLLFGFNRSLRYVDYFTGAKAQPLAVGDVNVAVNNQLVNAVDITRGIQRQRFFNAVNRVGRKMDEYLQSFGGKDVAPDYHNPLFLAHTTDAIGNSEVENTGAAQQSAGNSVTSTLRSYSSDMAFEIQVDRPCVIIGIVSFDIARYYSENIEAQNFHSSRFDMFNQYMQFLGDQPISGDEIHAGYHAQPFGYGLRHIEYKSRVNQCFGAFGNGSLPGWQFIADETISPVMYGKIGPDYIRSRCSELDKFYVSLTGYSLGTYFHFIVDNNNLCDPSRPMVYAPTIL